YSKSFDTADSIPDFVMAYERETLEDPGVVVQLNLRHTMPDRKLEPPNRLLLTKWPGAGFPVGEQIRQIEKWDVPLADPKGAVPDSAIVLYWDAKTLKNGEKRDLGYTYSLGSAASATAGRLMMKVGGIFVEGREFSVVAAVSNAKADETVQLELP